MVLQVSARIALQATFYRDSLNIEQALISHFYGFRFDLRLACLVAGMPLLAGIVPWLNRWIHPVAGSVFGAQGKMNWFWPLAASTVVGLWSLLVYADFGNMAYWQQRLNVGVLFLLRDLETNTRVLWDSYPVIVLALCTTTLMLISYLWVKSWANRLARNALEQPSEKKQPLTTLKAGLLNLSLISLVIFFIHGRWSQYPLRWSDLVRVGHPAAEQLAINPVQNIADTLAYRKPQFDRQATLSAYPHMAPWLGVPAAQTKPLNFSRTPPARSQPIIPRDANVVLVILESFSGYKSSLHGNKLDPTPKLKELADQGWWFHRFGSAHPLTARGVYSIITSRPDVSAGDTASRNPQAILHRSLIADWKEHQPYYFIGGSTSWANVRGLLTKAVPGIKIYEEENLKTPRTDVWGLSDRNLFYESLAILNQHVIEKQTPFFAVIQTAANHRPYTIPGDDQEFRVSQTSEAEALAHGMIGGMSELNAIRLMDHSVAKFMERARQSTWFDNTTARLARSRPTCLHGYKHPIWPPFIPRSLFMRPSLFSPNKSTPWANKLMCCLPYWTSPVAVQSYVEWGEAYCPNGRVRRACSPAFMWAARNMVGSTAAIMQRRSKAALPAKSSSLISARSANISSTSPNPIPSEHVALVLIWKPITKPQDTWSCTPDSKTPESKSLESNKS
jgi:Sulfatase